MKTTIEKIPKYEKLCKKIKCNGFAKNIYYEVEGKGCPLLLINGGPGATHHYFHPSFSRAANFCKVIYYDQAGSGLSERHKKYSINDSLRDIEILRKELKFEKWYILGHSYGGLLAQFYTIKYPRRVSGLILCCALPGLKVRLSTIQEKEKVLTENEIGKIDKIERDNIPEPTKYFNMLLNGLWKKHYFKKPSKKRMAEMSLYDYKADSKLVKDIDKEIKTIDLKGKFENFQIPTLIIEAENDLIWHPDKIEKLKCNHPRAKFILMKKARHYPFEDEPDKFFKAISRFINVTRL